MCAYASTQAAAHGSCRLLGEVTVATRSLENPTEVQNVNGFSTSLDLRGLGSSEGRWGWSVACPRWFCHVVFGGMPLGRIPPY